MVLFVSNDALPNDALKLSILIGDKIKLEKMPENKSWNFLKKGLIFRTEDQRLIFESNTIARYLNDSLSEKLTPQLLKILDILELEENFISKDDGNFAFQQILNYLEKSLKKSSFLVPQQNDTIADISLWSYLYCHFNLYYKDSFDTASKSHPLSIKWYNSKLGNNLYSLGVSFFQKHFLPNLKIVVKQPKLEPFQPLLKIREGIKYQSKHLNEVLPIEGERNILITSALPYVNNIPHLGNIIGCVLSADVYARYCRLKGYNTLYICGTDEYGTATETKALQEGLTCQQICDKYHALHSDAYKWFEISFDHFGRTTTNEQTEIAQDIFMKLKENNYLTKGSMVQLLCENCNRYLADRFVEGTCPKCGYEDARGDQCDKCGNLINAEELIKPRCKICSKQPVLRNSDHMFLDLTVLQPKCEDFVEKSFAKGKWSTNGYSITQNWLKEGLKPRCITRDLKWGTPVPLEDMKEKVFYVWFDAPIGYLSITATYTKQWEKWWKNPEQVQLYQFMGKDNVPFHTVIFPSSLIGTSDPYTLLHHVSTTEYLNYESGKFSKSRGVGVFGNNVVETGIPSSIWRFYLLAIRPETNDSLFTWSDFALKVNTELLANLGNFVNRTLKFLKSNFRGEVPNYKFTTVEEDLIKNINSLLRRYSDALENVQIREGLRITLELTALGNQYLTDFKLDGNLLETKREKCSTLIALCVNIIYYVATLIHPYMPSTSDSILTQLHAPLRSLCETFTMDILPGHCIGTPAHLFSRIEDSTVASLREKFKGKSDEEESKKKEKEKKEKENKKKKPQQNNN